MLLLRAMKGFPVKLSENGESPQVQILRTGKFKHPVYGDFEITPAILTEMKANFDNKIRGIDIALDYFHESDKEASGWIKALELRDDGQSLWAFVDWTPSALEKIKNKELKYFSPDFAFQWSDPESGQSYSNVLFGGGLTNRPFVKEMATLAAAEIDNLKMKGAKMTEAEILKMKEELAAANKKLAELAALPVTPPAPSDEVAALKAQIEELKAALEAAKADNGMMAEKIAAADKAKCLAEKEAAFTALLTEGKACAAQKDAFIKGDMNEFIKLAQPINLKGAGNTGTEGPSHEDKVLKLADDKMKADSKLSRGDALSQALKEIK